MEKDNLETEENNLCLFIPDWVETKSTLSVIEQAEVLISFGDWDNIC